MSRFSASENSRATPCMSWDCGPDEFVDARKMRCRVSEDGSITRATSAAGNPRLLAPSKRQLDSASLPDRRTGARQKCLQEHCRPNGDDRARRTCERRLAQPARPLLLAQGGVVDAHAEDCHLGHVDQRGHAELACDRRHGHCGFEAGGGHGHAEVQPRTAADDAKKSAGWRAAPVTSIGPLSSMRTKCLPAWLEREPAHGSSSHLSERPGL